MRDNRIVINYGESDYLPTDKEVSDWERAFLKKLVRWGGEKANDPEYLRESRNEYNKHGGKVIDTLIELLDDNGELTDFLADKYPDDLKDYFREAHERELSENNEPTLGELEREEYARAVHGGLR